jgi:hypothetical protein
MNVSRTIRSTGRPANLATLVAPGANVMRTALARAGLVKATVVAAAVVAAILAAIPGAQAQDAPVAGQSASAPASTPSASQAPSSPGPASATSSGTAPATADQAPAGQSAGSKSDPVCFKLTGHCVDSSKAATKAGTAGATKAGSGKKPLNLTAPDVRTVVPESELKEPLPSTDQVTETQEADTVSVKTEQGVPPDVPGGFGAIWWAMNHPSQAWRILAPAE